MLTKRIKLAARCALGALLLLIVSLAALSLAMHIYTGDERMVMVPTEKSYPPGVTELEARCFTPWILSYFYCEECSGLYRLSEDGWEPVEVIWENLDIYYNNPIFTHPLLQKSTFYLTNWYPEGVPPGRYRLELPIIADFLSTPLLPSSGRVYDALNELMSTELPYMAYCEFEVTE